jgi:Mg/Co/Ni transporter MgtE
LKTTLYPSQVYDRTESPAHRKEYHHLLKKLPVKVAMNTQFNKISNEAHVDEAIQIIKNSKSDNIVIVNQENKYVGFTDLHNLIKTNESEAKTTKIFPTLDVPIIDIEDSLYDTLKKISESITELPVTKHKDIVLGTISIADIIRAYDLELESIDEGKDEQASGPAK